MKKLLNDPLLHFLLIGTALFLAFEFFGKPSDNPEQQIIVSQGDISSLEANFKRTWQRPPTHKELDGLIDNRVLDEIAYREAKAMGLDKGDAIIERRLRLKLELLLEDVAGLASPTEADLQDYLEQNPQAFFIEPQFSFKQIYFSLDKQKATAEDRVQETLTALNEAGPEADSEQYGDPTLLPGEFPLSSAAIIKRHFGESFVEGLEKGAVGRWFGPLKSEYGLHLVLVGQYNPGRFPDLSEVRTEVERELTAERRDQVKEDTYRKLRERYSVMVEPQQTPTDAQPGEDN